MTLTEYPELEHEVWRTIPGMSEDYEVSNLGRLRSYRAHGGKRRELTPHIMTARINSHGYLSVGLQVASGKRQPFTVHALVAAAFLGPRPDGYEVAHWDGDGANSRLENLRYATKVDNAADKIRHGTTVRGEANGNRKLTEEEVHDIFLRYHRTHERQVDLAEEYGVSQSQVSNIVRGASWSHLAARAA